MLYKGSYALVGDKLTELLRRLHGASPRGLFEDTCVRAFMLDASKIAVAGGGKAMDRRHGGRILDHHRRVFGAHHVSGHSQDRLDRRAFGIAVSDLINDCRFLCSS